jgi:sec-independent protein translocase protein TatC
MSDDSPGEGFLGHLVELRARLLRALIAVLAAFVAMFFFAKYLYEWFAKPLLESLPTGGTPISVSPIGPFVVQLKLALFAAFCLALPYVLYQIWRFVAPGLYRREKRFVAPLIISSTALFFAGMGFAYFVVFRAVFGFIADIAPAQLHWTPDAEQYLSFALRLFLAFGVAFEVPIAVFLLVRGGIVEVQTLKNARPYIIVGAFVIAAIFTPPDVISQLLLAIPCWLLFELGLFIAARTAPAKEEEEEDDKPAAAPDAAK